MSIFRELSNQELDAELEAYMQSKEDSIPAAACCFIAMVVLGAIAVLQSLISGLPL